VWGLASYIQVRTHSHMYDVFSHIFSIFSYILLVHMSLIFSHVFSFWSLQELYGRLCEIGGGKERMMGYWDRIGYKVRFVRKI